MNSSVVQLLDILRLSSAKECIFTFQYGFQISDSDDSSALSEGSDNEDHHRIKAPIMSPMSPVYPTADPDSWKRAGNGTVIISIISRKKMSVASLM